MSDSLTLARKVVLVDLDSGEQVYVEPISPLLVNAMVNDSHERFPYPDETPYRLPLENAAIEGDTMPAANNPEYRKLCQKIDMERVKYQNNALIFMSVRDAPAGRDTLIAKYTGLVEQTRRHAPLPDDPWEATLSVLVVSRNDYQFVIQAATEGILITFDQLRDGMRIFRLKVQEQTDRVVVGTQSASNSTKKHAVRA